MTKTVYLSLGSNVGDRRAHLLDAVRRLNECGVKTLRSSPVYETEPVDCDPQRWFLNQALECETDLLPRQLLARINRVEREMGRVRTVRNAPRTIDIDILLYGSSVMQAPELEIPHPGMAERRFVLAPLADLAPELHHPLHRKTVKELLDTAPQQTVRRVVE